MVEKLENFLKEKSDGSSLQGCSQLHIQTARLSAPVPFLGWVLSIVVEDNPQKTWDSLFFM